MGKLIIVVGNTGVGKTTLTQQLCQQGGFVSGLEQQAERPFQQLFANDLLRYALPNQVDFLLRRAEQEWAIRQQPAIGIQDGGLETDFWLFTRRFYQKGYLDEPAYQLCTRLYTFFRQLLPPPDLIIHLVAPLEVIAARHAQRNRPLEIAQLDDLVALDALLTDWLTQVDDIPILTVDAAHEDPTYTHAVRRLLTEINLAHLTKLSHKPIIG